METPAYRAEEVNLLKNCQLFHEFDEHEFQQILGTSVRSCFEKGQTIFTEGESSDILCIIISGSVDVYKSEHEGRKQCLITTLSSGESLGEMRLIQDAPCSLTAIAASPVILLQLSVHTLREKENEKCFSLLLISIINILNKRLKLDNQNIVTISGEKRRKVKQLFYSIIVIVTLGALLAELGFAFYYLTHTEDFCRMQYEIQGNNNTNIQ